MSENREYISRADEMGAIHIADEVLAGIAAAAVLEVEGVTGLAGNLGSDLAELLGKKHLGKGVHIQMDGERVTAEISILVLYGCIIPDVATAVQESVKNAIESMGGLPVAGINVTIAGITFPAKP